MSQLYANCPPYWTFNDQQISENLSKSLTLKVDSPPQLETLDFHLQDQDSPSSQSTQSNHDLTVIAGKNSHDQCMSSESGQEVCCGKNVGDAKPAYMMSSHPNIALNACQIDYSNGMACMPYPCVDPHFNGLMAAYGAAPIPQVKGVTSPRVPLPLDISEEEPIFVNAKQYHGILRRRQLRAKLEAQNKVIKARKPYLHESRHLHALNRVRGSGGRFLSTTKLRQSDSPSVTGHHTGPSNAHDANNLVFKPQDADDGTSNFLKGGVFFQQAD